MHKHGKMATDGCSVDQNCLKGSVYLFAWTAGFN